MTAPLHSEFDLIRFIRRSVGPLRPGVSGPIGDDCAVFEGSFARRFVVTTDMMVEGEHFQREWISPSLLGRKLCRVNLSDLAAMGAKPFGCLLNLGMPPDCRGGYFEALLKGFLREAEPVSMSLIGGDLSRSKQLFLAVTALGYVDSGEPILRSGAREGDSLMLIGDLGLSRQGLEMLRAARPPDFERIESEEYPPSRGGRAGAWAALRAHYLPEVHLGPGAWLRERGLARSMIDVSDGLAADVLHLLEESGVSAEVDAEALLSASADPEIPLEYLLNGGEDYALVFTASAEQVAAIGREYPKEWPRPIAIGRVFAGSSQLFLRREGDLLPLRPAGFDHFR